MHHWIWFALQLMTDPSKSTGFCVLATATDRAGRVTNTVLVCRVFLPTQPELSQAGHGRLPKKKKKKKWWGGYNERSEPFSLISPQLTFELNWLIEMWLGLDRSPTPHPQCFCLAQEVAACLSLSFHASLH